MTDWEGLKAFNADFKAFRGQNTALAIAESLSAILAQRESDQRVIEAAKKLADQVVVYLEGGDTVALDAALAEFDKVKP